jgi:hypothetical protein
MKTLMARGRNAFITVAVIGFVLITSTGAWAQQKFKYSYTDPGGLTKYTAQHVLDVGDVAGHQIRVATLQTKYTKEAPEYDGVKVVESTLSLTSDYINASGRFMQYGVLQMANDDKIFTRVEGLSQTSTAVDGTKKTSFSTVTTLTGGTGKFASVRGTIRGGGTTDFKIGTTGNPSEGEYWFEK